MASTKIRYLVLDRTNTPQRPADHGLHLAGLQNPKSPSFLDGATAGKFQQMLAQKNPGQAFYLSKVESVAIAFDNPDNLVKVGEDKCGNKAREVSVTTTTADGAGDE